MSTIEDLLKDKLNDKIDYELLLKKFPWINEREKSCILSPDSDGLLCGLFLSKYRNWKIVGFYDDKVGVINSNYISKDLIFLDGEIFRHNAKSMGHHMLKLNKNQNVDFSKFDNCIQPNLLRNYDGKHDFRLKYPLATIHMLISIIAYADNINKGHTDIQFTETAVAPLFFTDGVFNVLFSYPENVLNWLSYLRINEEWNPLKNIFENETFSVFTTMKLMNKFFRERDKITFGKERGDRLKISSKDGTPYNIEEVDDYVQINLSAKERIIKFMNLVGNMTNFPFKNENWLCWNHLKYFKFTKQDFKKHNWTLTNANFEKFLSLNPLSWAMTSGENIEFTLEEPSTFNFL